VRCFLEQCLNTLYKAAASLDMEVFVVDNASFDDSKIVLPQKFPQVQFRWNQTNIGFSKANNSVLREAKGTHILFLNPDTIIPENALITCLDFFKKHPDAGALGVPMIDGHGSYLRESKRGFPSTSNAFWKMTGLSNLFPNSSFFSGYYAGHIPENKTASVEVLSGAFFMITEKMMNRIGGFDSDYFMYGEDIDLSYRVKKTGFKNYYFSEVTILHFKGESTKRDSPAFKKHFFDAMSIFIDKHIEGPAIKRKFLHWGVQFFKKIAFFSASKIAKTESSILVGNKEINMLIVANQTHFNEMIQLLKTGPNPICISGRISNMITDTDPCSGHLDHLDEVVKSTHANAILFCESPELSYYKIIDVMKSNPKIASFFIHSEFSTSIIGSSFSEDWSVLPSKVNESVPVDV
jgi:GT2 family glycosyltransferase